MSPRVDPRSSDPAAGYASMVAAFSLYCSSKAWTLQSFAAYDSAKVDIIYAYLHHSTTMKSILLFRLPVRSTEVIKRL